MNKNITMRTKITKKKNRCANEPVLQRPIRKHWVMLDTAEVSFPKWRVRLEDNYPLMSRGCFWAVYIRPIREEVERIDYKAIKKLFLPFHSLAAFFFLLRNDKQPKTDNTSPSSHNFDVKETTYWLRSRLFESG